MILMALTKTTIHFRIPPPPDWRRCSSLACSQACSFFAPCHPSVAASRIWQRIFLRILKTMLFMIIVPYGSLAYGEEAASPTQKTFPKTSAELRQLYERTIEAGEKLQIPDDVIERAREEIKRIGTWEYRVMTLNAPQDTALEQHLNELGQDRWECHATLRGQEEVRLICKRPVRSYFKNIAVTDLLKLIP